MIKKLTILFLLFAFMQISFSCKEDNVVFITQNDNLGINEAFEFKFDEVTGNTTKESLTNSNYNISGKGINRMDGVDSKALFFDGLSNEIEGTLPTNLLPNERFVISLWAAPRTYPLGTSSMIALTQQNSSTGVMVGVNNLGQLVVQYFINGAFAQQVSSLPLTRNEWSHIVVGLNPADQNVVVYLNKNLIINQNTTSGSISWPTNSTAFSIGKNTMGEMMGIYDIDYYSGALDEIKIYSGKATQDVVDFINNQYVSPTNVDYQLNIDYSSDFNRPTYHAVPDFGWANESYGLLYLDNKYQMFYQKNEVFLGIAKQNWGRFTSTDLVNWQEENAVLWPSESWDIEGAWAGSSIILNDGTPAIAYTGVDGIKAGVGIATSSDNFQTLTKDTSNPVISQAPSDVDLDFRDPFVWEENGTYHMIVGSGISSIGGNVVYYSSPDFKNWTYGGIAFQGQQSQGQGRFWEVPILYEFPNGKDMLLVQKTPDATKARTFYWIGDFNNGVFTPDSPTPKNLEIVNGFLSPTITADQMGNITAIGIIPDEVTAEFHMQQGWANLFSVPQVWELDGNNTIKVKPHPNLEALRGTQTSYNGLNLQDGVPNNFNGFKSRFFEMEASINIGTASEIGFVFGKSANEQEEYKVFYDVINQKWVVDASKSSLSTEVRKDIRKGNFALSPGSTIDVRIFIDGSVIEVFIDDESHFTGRFFPTLPDANGVEIYANGGNANADINIYEINN